MDQKPYHLRKEEHIRLPYKIPVGLIENIETKGHKHLPRPEKRVFLQFIIKMGLDTYEERIFPTAANIGRPLEPGERTELGRFDHFIDRDVADRFHKHKRAEAPPITATSFFEYILNLGVQAYEREYTIYGFKRD